MSAPKVDQTMKVLIACEYSGVEREAFRALGHDAISCDLLPSDDDSPHHHQGDVRDLMCERWDLVIAHRLGIQPESLQRRHAA